jgi:hypothetical protein
MKEELIFTKKENKITNKILPKKKTKYFKKKTKYFKKKTKHFKKKKRLPKKKKNT